MNTVKMKAAAAKERAGAGVRAVAKGAGAPKGGAGVPKGAGTGRRKRSEYHHGDLRHELLVATEKIILERGVDGFTLREAARRAGVSPAAPAHHFKDARGLLTEVSLLGFRDFGKALEEADRAGGADPARRLHEQARAYVRFALENPARFQLMFRHDKQDLTNQEFVDVAHRSYLVLEGAVRAATGTAAGQELSAAAVGFLQATWSIVHGFSHLALGGELNDRKQAPAGKEEILNRILPFVLAHLPKPTRL